MRWIEPAVSLADQERRVTQMLQELERGGPLPGTALMCCLAVATVLVWRIGPAVFTATPEHGLHLGERDRRVHRPPGDGGRRAAFVRLGRWF